MRFDDIMPLPTPEPTKRIATRSKSPNSIYTSPESLHYIKDKDKDSHIDFDTDEPENKRSHGRTPVRAGQARGRGMGQMTYSNHGFFDQNTTTQW